MLQAAAAGRPEDSPRSGYEYSSGLGRYSSVGCCQVHSYLAPMAWCPVQSLGALCFPQHRYWVPRERARAAAALNLRTTSSQLGVFLDFPPNQPSSTARAGSTGGTIATVLYALPFASIARHSSVSQRPAHYDLISRSPSSFLLPLLILPP